MNTIKKSIFIVVAFFALAGTANAAKLNYNYANINYVSNDTLGVSFTGFGLEGSFGVSDNMNVYAAYVNPSYSGVGITETTLGIGYHQPIDNKSDWYVRGNYHTFGDFASGVSGFSVVGGSRMMLNDKFEMDANIGFANYDAGGTSYSGMIFAIDGTYHVNDSYGVTLGYMSDNDAFGWTGFKIGARINF